MHKEMSLPILVAQKSVRHLPLRLAPRSKATQNLMCTSLYSPALPRTDVKGLLAFFPFCLYILYNAISLPMPGTTAAEFRERAPANAR